MVLEVLRKFLGKKKVTTPIELKKLTCKILTEGSNNPKLYQYCINKLPNNHYEENRQNLTEGESMYAGIISRTFANYPAKEVYFAHLWADDNNALIQRYAHIQYGYIPSKNVLFLTGYNLYSIKKYNYIKKLILHIIQKYFSEYKIIQKAEFDFD